eukprot:570128-Rhodomonas_salina.1
MAYVLLQLSYSVPHTSMILRSMLDIIEYKRYTWCYAVGLRMILRNVLGQTFYMVLCRRPGTNAAYDPTQRARHHRSAPGRALRPHRPPGTLLPYSTTPYLRTPRTLLPYPPTPCVVLTKRMLLYRIQYWPTICCYADATTCPVLTYSYRRAWYWGSAMLSTDVDSAVPQKQRVLLGVHNPQY